jgi:hypothetical protein
MERVTKPYVQVAVDDVDTVVYDPEGRYDADLYDRYSSFEQARDAALSCIEDVLEEGDYEGENHKTGLETMLGLLEAAQILEDLEGQPEYRRLLKRLDLARPVAA